MNEKVYGYMDWPRIEAVVYGEEASPKDVMAPRLTPDGVLIQGFFPEAWEASVLVGEESYPMEREDDAGYFGAMIPGRKLPAYRFQVKKGEEVQEFYDPYAFPGFFTEEDEKAFLGGVSYEIYEKLGAHPAVVSGVEGTCFAVWAPNALRVSVVGDFNDWDGRRMPMQRMPMSGIYELFVPGAKPGDAYKYEIKVKGGDLLLKADPYGFGVQAPPSCASVVADTRSFAWNDGAWMKERAKYADRRQPMSIYETSLTQWESGQALLDFVAGLGYTHVELHPVMEYLDEGSGGYATTAYFAPTTRYGSPEDFQKTVDLLHQGGIGVILDWTPAHFPRFEGGLELFDGTPLYEVKDPSYALHPMWGTMLYNYESPMVVDFLISNACFWLEVYHADGLRLDDVDAMLYLDYGRSPGEWKANIYGTNENLAAVEFLKHLNSILAKRSPGAILIAQEDGLWPELTEAVEKDHIGFGYKWSGGWTKDFLSYLKTDPILRKNVHDQLTLSMVYAYSEHYVLTLGTRDVGDLSSFMELLPGDETMKEAQVREVYGYQMLHPGCKMTAPDASCSPGLKACIQDLHKMYKAHPALYAMDHSYDGFEWVQLMKYEENVVAFLRKTDKPEESLLAVCNFAAIPYESYQVGVPFHGKYKEIFNSDAKQYGGEGRTNPRVKTSKKEECDEREYSIRLTLPALGVTVFTCTPAEEKAASPKEKSAVRSAAKKTAAPKRKKAEDGLEKKTVTSRARKKAEAAAEEGSGKKTAAPGGRKKTGAAEKVKESSGKKTAASRGRKNAGAAVKKAEESSGKVTASPEENKRAETAPEK
ncbi:MAG: 1,4-alpha-glucan branching enzyme [Eubacteriales bacterium]|nr:1,4-alpha-glucan branching enzyme [Eubacteriales bacterium]